MEITAKDVMELRQKTGVGMMECKKALQEADGDSEKAARILREKGIDLIPDIVCNAGGVIVSYFEWLQNKRSEFWDLDEVDAKLRRRILGGYERVRNTVSEYGTDWRTAAYIVALQRLEKVYRKRGIFP